MPTTGLSLGVPGAPGSPADHRPLVARASLGELRDQPGWEVRRLPVGQQPRQFVVDAGAGLFAEDDDMRHLRDDQVLDGEPYLLVPEDAVLDGPVGRVRRAARRHGLRFGPWFDDRQLADFNREGTTHFRAVPDGFFLLRNDAAQAAYGLAPERRHWVGKIEGYLTYFAREYPREAILKGVATPVVLTVTVSAERQANLLVATKAVGGAEGFWFTTLDALDSEETPDAPRGCGLHTDLADTDGRHAARPVRAEGMLEPMPFS